MVKRLLLEFIFLFFHHLSDSISYFEQPQALKQVLPLPSPLRRPTKPRVFHSTFFFLKHKRHIPTNLEYGWVLTIALWRGCLSGVIWLLWNLQTGSQDSRAPSLPTKTVLSWIQEMELMQENGWLKAAMKRTTLFVENDNLEGSITGIRTFFDKAMLHASWTILSRSMKDPALFIGLSLWFCRYRSFVLSHFGNEIVRTLKKKASPTFSKLHFIQIRFVYRAFAFDVIAAILVFPYKSSFVRDTNTADMAFVIWVPRDWVKTLYRTRDTHRQFWYSREVIYLKTGPSFPGFCSIQKQFLVFEMKPNPMTPL